MGSSGADNSRCFGCGAPVGNSGPCVHPYLGASVECWELFGLLQTLEMERYGYPEVHRLVVDAYAAQHPGPGVERRDRQSVFVHLASIHLVLEEGRTSADASELLRRLTQGRPEFPQLQRAHPGLLDLRHAWDAADLADYEKRVREWADAVWTSYEPSHDIIRRAAA